MFNPYCILKFVFYSFQSCFNVLIHPPLTIAYKSPFHPRRLIDHLTPILTLLTPTSPHHMTPLVTTHFPPPHHLTTLPATSQPPFHHSTSLLTTSPPKPPHNNPPPHTTPPHYSPKPLHHHITLPSPPTTPPNINPSTPPHHLPTTLTPSPPHPTPHTPQGTCQ